MAITRAVAKIVETIGDTIRRLAILRLSRILDSFSPIIPKKRIVGFGIRYSVASGQFPFDEHERERERESDFYD